MALWFETKFKKDSLLLGLSPEGTLLLCYSLPGVNMYMYLQEKLTEMNIHVHSNG